MKSNDPIGQVVNANYIIDKVRDTEVDGFDMTRLIVGYSSNI